MALTADPTTGRPHVLPVDPSGIPGDLRDRPQWVAWRAVLRDGRWTKKPLNSSTMQGADSNKPETWGALTDALRRVEAGHADGIGFVLSPDDPFVFVDIDGCRNASTGKLSGFAEELVERFASWTEVSPSGTGLHIICRGRLPEGCRRKDTEHGIEAYDRARYFCVTGRTIRDAGIADRQLELDAFVGEYLTREKSDEGGAATAAPVPPGEDAQRIIDKMLGSRNGEKIRRLMNGDLTDHNGDHSSADLALCNSLAFWTGRDPALMDEVFRSSGLYRDKWDSPRGGSSYGEWTIQRAIEDCRETYNWDQHQGAVSPALTHNNGFDAQFQPEQPTKKKRLTIITSAEFDAQHYPQTYMVKGVLCEGQNFILAGSSKTLKTSVAVDLVMSLGSGVPFLGKFEVPAPRRVAILSGESGERTLQETARRVCASKGIEFRDANVCWGFTLPQLYSADDLLELRELILDNEIEFLLLDPAYLCLLDAESANQASNVFGMGSRLLILTELLQQTGCTIGIVHHSRKNRMHLYEPMELEDLAQAGFAEWARQWCLLSRREAYDLGSGDHRLWLSLGGSAGHNSLHGLDIEEGTPEQYGGRTWRVETIPGGELRKEQQSKATRKKEEKQEEAARGRQLKIIETLRKYPNGLSKTQTSQKSGVNPAHTAHALNVLIDEDLVCECQLIVGNRKNTMQGYMLKHTNRTTQTDSNPV